jgi:hypothetical protein
MPAISPNFRSLLEERVQAAILAWLARLIVNPGFLEPNAFAAAVAPGIPKLIRQSANLGARRLSQAFAALFKTRPHAGISFPRSAAGASMPELEP